MGGRRSLKSLTTPSPSQCCVRMTTISSLTSTRQVESHNGYFLCMNYILWIIETHIISFITCFKQDGLLVYSFLFKIIYAFGISFRKGYKVSCDNITLKAILLILNGD